MSMAELQVTLSAKVTYGGSKQKHWKIILVIIVLLMRSLVRRVIYYIHSDDKLLHTFAAERLRGKLFTRVVCILTLG